MKKNNIALIFAIILLTISCTPTISTKIINSHPILDYKEKVYVFELNNAKPVDSEILGSVNISGVGQEICSYWQVLEQAKLEARKVGGNAIKVTKHIPPSMWGSQCHSISAEVLLLKNIDKFQSKEQDLLDVNYSILNIYRHPGIGSLISYDIFLEDSIICRVGDNYKTTVNIKKEGFNVLWAKTGSAVKIPIFLEPGKTYYVRCGIVPGSLVGLPTLELVENSLGEIEYESIKSNK